MKGRHWIVPLALFPTLLASEAPAQKKTSLAGWHNDKKHGFAVRLIEAFSKPTPIQPAEEYEIAKFAGPELVVGKENVNFQTDFRIVRFELKGSPTGAGVAEEAKGGKKEGDPEDGGKTDPEEAKRAMREAMRAHSFKDWLKGPSGFSVLGETKEKDLALASKLPAKEYEFSLKTGMKTPASGYAAVVQTAGQEIALVWAIPETHYKDWVGAFRSAAKTFKPIETEAPAAAAAAAGSEVEAKMAMVRERSPGRLVDHTEHYVVVFDPDKKKWLPQIKKRIEAIRGRLELDFPPEKPITAVSVLRVCKDKDEYHQYGGPGGSAGYWSDRDEELVIFVDQENPSDTWRTMQHEAFHQYIYYRCGKLAPHSWYNEGTGDYYAGADFKLSGEFEIDIFLWRRDTIRDAIRAGTHVPLAKILRYTQPEYYANARLCYAQGWSMVYFLREGKKRGAKGWDPAWEGILPTYLQKLIEANARGEEEGKARETAINAALQGIDIDALEKAWIQFTT